MGEITTASRGVTGTFRVYEDGVHIGYVLTRARPGEGPHWTRPLGYQGYTVKDTLAVWAPGKVGAVAALVAAHRAESA